MKTLACLLAITMLAQARAGPMCYARGSPRT